VEVTDLRGLAKEHSPEQRLLNRITTERMFLLRAASGDEDIEDPLPYEPWGLWQFYSRSCWASPSSTG